MGSVRKYCCSVWAFVLMGCATNETLPESISYSPPSVKPTPLEEATVAASYDAVWSALINHVSSSFFSIENFEKESGLITLSFGASNISDYVNCGHWNLNSAYPFNGNYANYIVRNSDGNLSGKMNISLYRQGKSVNVRVNARYVLTSQERIYAGTIYAENIKNVWSFDTGSSDTVSVMNPALAPGMKQIGTRGVIGLSGPNTPLKEPELYQITCQPTGQAEGSILAAVKEIVETG